jgi:hypothetical protein
VGSATAGSSAVGSATAGSSAVGTSTAGSGAACGPQAAMSNITMLNTTNIKLNFFMAFSSIDLISIFYQTANMCLSQKIFVNSSNSTTSFLKENIETVIAGSSRHY